MVLPGGGNTPPYAVFPWYTTPPRPAVSITAQSPNDYTSPLSLLHNTRLRNKMKAAFVLRTKVGFGMKGITMKTFLKGILLLVGLAALFLAGPVIYYFPMYNFRTVDEGAFYGSRQMGGFALEKAIHKRGIRTVINLRGENPGSDWYDEEAATCAQAGVKLVNLGWSQGSLPEPDSLARFVEVVESGEGPFLAHCAGGTHRTGVAAAVYLLLKGADVPTARKQFRIGFNDAPIGQLLDLYEGSAIPFRQWILEVYPGVYDQIKEMKTSEESVPRNATTSATSSPLLIG